MGVIAISLYFNELVYKQEELNFDNSETKKHLSLKRIDISS